jgi:hypothetical protein
LAPFLLLAAVVLACGSPEQIPGAAPRVPAASAAGDIEEVSLEISSLM